MAEDKDQANLFTGFAADYDRMIDWTARLKREEPFFRRVFAEAEAGKLLDTACATGRHAIMFSSWGLEVAASDISPDMVALARENAAAAGCDIKFAQAGMEEIDSVFDPGFDVVTCLGNSLPHMRTPADLARALAAAAAVLGNGGLYVCQLKNYHRIYARQEKFMPLNARTVDGREYLYLRISEPAEQKLTFHIVVMTRDEKGSWSYRVESEELRPWRLPDLETFLREAGFAVTGVFGDMAGNHFDPGESPDLIIVACKGG